MRFCFLQLPILLPIFLLAVSLLILVLTCLQKPAESLLAVILILAGIPLYLIGVLWRSKPREISDLIREYSSSILKDIINYHKIFNKANLHMSTKCLKNNLYFWFQIKPRVLYKKFYWLFPRRKARNGNNKLGNTETRHLLIFKLYTRVHILVHRYIRKFYMLFSSFALTMCFSTCTVQYTIVHDIYTCTSNLRCLQDFISFEMM